MIKDTFLGWEFYGDFYVWAHLNFSPKILIKIEMKRVQLITFFMLFQNEKRIQTINWIKPFSQILFVFYRNLDFLGDNKNENYFQKQIFKYKIREF